MFTEKKEHLKVSARILSLVVVSEVIFATAVQSKPYPGENTSASENAGTTQSASERTGSVQIQKNIEGLVSSTEGVVRTGRNSFSLSGREDTFQGQSTTSREDYLKAREDNQRFSAWSQQNASPLNALKGWVYRNHPNILNIASTIPASKIMNVRGCYDHEGDALRFLGFHFTDVAQFNSNVDLSGVNVLIVNCGAFIAKQDQERIANFVKDGGYLVTTDLEARSLLHEFAPGDIKNNGTWHNPPLATVSNSEADLVTGTAPEGPWTLAGNQASYKPNPDVIPVVYTSQKPFGPGKSLLRAIVLSIHYGNGRILHLSGHFGDIGSDVIPQTGTSLRQAIFLNFLISGLSRHQSFVR
jgi:hypothetical protein